MIDSDIGWKKGEGLKMGEGLRDGRFGMWRQRMEDGNIWEKRRMGNFDRLYDSFPWKINTNTISYSAVSTNESLCLFLVLHICTVSVALCIRVCICICMQVLQVYPLYPACIRKVTQPSNRLIICGSDCHRSMVLMGKHECIGWP